jgi:hypothetical protein
VDVTGPHEVALHDEAFGDEAFGALRNAARYGDATNMTFEFSLHALYISLGFLRLAAVACVCWGIRETSGRFALSYGEKVDMA